MKLRSCIFLLLVALLLTGCYDEGNWFYHPVKFTGEVEAPRLVVHGNLHSGYEPFLRVSHSAFALDKLPDTIPVVEDAAMEMRINGGEWGSVWRSVKSGDCVELHFSHPDYGEAWAKQTLPAPVYAVGTTTHEWKELNGDLARLQLRGVDLQINKQHLAEGSLIRVAAVTYCTDHYPAREDKRCYNCIYTTEKAAKTYRRFHNELSDHHYGAAWRGLYLDVAEIGEHFSCEVLFQPDLMTDYGAYYWTDSVVMEITVMTPDERLYLTSLVQAGNYPVVTPVLNPYADSTRYEPGNIFENISNMFDEMGGMEGVQIYNNISGGMGHLSAETTTRCRVYSR